MLRMAMFQGRALALFPRVLDARSIVPSPVIIRLSAAEEDGYEPPIAAGILDMLKVSTMW